MAGSLRNYYSLMYGPTELDDSESTDKRTAIDLDTDIDLIDITDEDFQDKDTDQNEAQDGKSSPFDIDVSVEGLQCQICRRQFHNEDTLKNHLDMHTLYSNNECAYCHKVFTLKKNLNRHEARIHFVHSGLYHCLTCPKIYPHPDILSNHLKVCSSGEPRCYICSQRLETFEDLSAHQENEHNLHGYVCGFCAASLPTEEELGTHLKFCKKAPVGQENKDPNSKGESNVQNCMKMSQFEEFNVVPKMKGRKRRVGNELE